MPGGEALGSWIVRARGVRSNHVQAMDALASAGFDVEVSPRGTHSVSRDEVILIVWLRNTRLSAAQFEQNVRTALVGLAYEIDTSLLSG